MGNLIKSKSSQLLKDAYNPSFNNWNMIERGNEFNIWANNYSHEEIEQYRFMVNDEQEFERQKKIFEARHSNSNLVASMFFVDDSQKQFCANYFKGNLFLERIPFRLFELEKITFPDILHVYSQCFKGFAELFDVVGFFSIHQQMIGINTDGVVKVWHNKNFGKSQPDPVYVQGTQRQMVIRLIKMLSNCCDKQLPINLSDQLLRHNSSSFKDAFIHLQNLATRFNVDIPDYLSTIFGNMRKMIKNNSMVSSLSHYTSHYNPKSKTVSNVSKYSIGNQTILNKDAMAEDTMNRLKKQMPINYNNHLKGSSHSMASAFPDLSRISRISLPKERKIKFIPATTFSPPQKTPFQTPRSPQKRTQPLLLSPPTPKFNKNTDLYYSVAGAKIPTQSIKHLPIIRQNQFHQNSNTSSNNGNSFKYHVSDRNKLTQKYLNKIKNPEHTSLYTSINPQSIDINQTLSKNNNSFKQLNKRQVDADSGISKFSMFKKSQYDESVNGISLIKQPTIALRNQSFYHSDKVSNISKLPVQPVVSSSNTGVVYRQGIYRQPTIISQSSVMNQSYSFYDQNPIKQKISMKGNDYNPYRNNAIEQSYYSPEINPQLLQDLNTFRRKKLIYPEAAS